MMKKAFVISILIVLSLASAFAKQKDERVWYYRDEGTYNITSVDLGKTFYLPKYSTPYGKKANDGTPENGTYAIATNVIGNIGCAFTSHKIKFTISTDGRFVSQSDPTKYREFYLALKPRMRRDGAGDDENYNWDEDGNAIENVQERVPNTKHNNSVSVTAPKQIRNGNVSDVTLEGLGTVDFLRYYCDICICMDELTSDDLTHLKSGDDYLATIIIEWECIPEGETCSDQDLHNGSFIFVINGSYDVEESNKDQIFLTVNPAPNVMDLDLVSIVNTDGDNNKVHIADIELYAVTLNKDWARDITFFVSSSNDPDSPDATGFRLLNRDAGFYIPYSVIVDNYDLMTWTQRTGKKETKTFDGTDTSSSGKKIDISSSVKSITNKNGKQFKSVAYGGKVYINIDTKAYTDPDYYEQEVEIDYVGIADEQNIYHQLISGVYTSTIYYYVIYK